MAQRKLSSGLDSIFRKTETPEPVFRSPFASPSEAEAAPVEPAEEESLPVPTPPETTSETTDEFIPPARPPQRRAGRPVGSVNRPKPASGTHVREKNTPVSPELASEILKIVRAIDLDEGRFRSVGVGLREGEVDALDLIAENAGVTRNAILRYAVRYFLRQFQSGKAEIAVEEQRSVSLLLP